MPVTAGISKSRKGGTALCALSKEDWCGIFYIAMQRTLATETVTKVGQKVKLQGWINTIRDHGKLVFVELRDRSGLLQIVGDQTLGNVHPEYVVEIVGTVAQRPKSMVNPNLATGEIEVQMESYTIVSQSSELPFPIDSKGTEINEEIRLKYRYLDLRRERLQKIIKTRSKFVELCRQFLFNHDFVEIETPLLTQSTPEGSRDFLVPARLQPGKFFALPQSPQQYKQLLMVAGFERYFQIARCLRDEDPRADRGFEFSQIDIEMSFVTEDEVMAMDEAMITSVVESLGFTLKQKPFPRISYKEAMEKYGADKFDLRNDDEKKAGVLAFAWVVDFPFFEKTEEGGWTFTHNPFSSPKPEYLDDLLAQKNIENILTQQYDLVCNGCEVGGGSIRAHQPEILKATYKIMGYDEERILTSIGHMLEAFKFGAPPHGGLAHGVERLIMTLMGEEALREVVAFPQTSLGTTSVTNAPSEIPDDQLKELGIQVRSIKSTTSNKQSVLDLIQNYLNREGVTYKTFSHKPVFTSEEAAQVRNTPLAEGAKALVVKADGNPMMIVLSASNKLDLNGFKKTYGVKDVSLVDKETLLQITGLEPGAVPPFGSLFKIPTYVDKGLTELEFVSFNAGSHTHSVQMKTEDFTRLEKPTVGTFAK